MHMKYISLLLASSLFFFSTMATAHHTMPPNPANQDHTAASKSSKCDSDNDSEGRKSGNDDGK